MHRRRAVTRRDAGTGPAPRRGTGPGVVLLVLGLSLGLVTSGCSSDAGDQPSGVKPVAGSGRPPGAGPGGKQSPHPSPLATVAPSWAKGQDNEPRAAPARIGTIHRVAQAVVPTVRVYRTPVDPAPWKTLGNPLPSRAPRVFLVQEQRGSWLRVLLPVRPNQSQGWIRSSDVRLSQHDYRMIVSISKHTLTVYRGSQIIMSEPVGLGTSSTPTPGGVYYTKELLKPLDPKGAYGPYAYGLSGFSPVLNEFLGGDGTVGIHGTNDPSGIGRSVSHGCIRIRNAAISKLAGMLPLGVPVQIVR